MRAKCDPAIIGADQAMQRGSIACLRIRSLPIGGDCNGASCPAASTASSASRARQLWASNTRKIARDQFIVGRQRQGGIEIVFGKIASAQAIEGDRQPVVCLYRVICTVGCLPVSGNRRREAIGL